MLSSLFFLAIVGYYLLSRKKSVQAIKHISRVGDDFFLGVISNRRVGVPSQKIVINLLKTYEKFHFKGFQDKRKSDQRRYGQTQECPKY